MEPEEKRKFNGIKKTIETYNRLSDAMKKNGIDEKAHDVRFKYSEAARRIRVTVDGEYYGIWDIDRETFVD